MDTSVSNPSPWLLRISQFQWVRAHVSLMAVGVVLLLSINLLMGGSRLWALTAIGIWGLLLLVHIILLAIARLSIVLITSEEEEEIVLLPIQEATVVPQVPSPARPTHDTTWKTTAVDTNAPELRADSGETVSWQIATDAARLKRKEDSEPGDDNP